MDCRVKPGNDERRKSFSRRIPRLITTGLDPVVHAEARHTRASRQLQTGGASAWIAGSSPAMTNAENRSRDASLASSPPGLTRWSMLTCSRQKICGEHQQASAPLHFPWRGEVATRRVAGGGESAQPAANSGLANHPHPVAPPTRRADPPPPGEGEMQNRSRGAPRRPSFCDNEATNKNLLELASGRA